METLRLQNLFATLILFNTKNKKQNKTKNKRIENC